MPPGDGNAAYGACTIPDITQDQYVAYYIENEPSSPTFQGLSAEWIMEDPSLGDTLAPFCNYGSVEITGCFATQSGGTPQDVADAVIWNIVQSGTTIAAGSVLGTIDVVSTFV